MTSPAILARSSDPAFVRECARVYARVTHCRGVYDCTWCIEAATEILNGEGDARSPAVAAVLRRADELIATEAKQRADEYGQSLRAICDPANASDEIRELHRNMDAVIQEARAAKHSAFVAESHRVRESYAAATAEVRAKVREMLGMV